MLKQRLLVIIFLVPIGIGIVALGGILFSLLITAILAVASWEYVQLARKGGYHPNLWLVVGGTIVLGLTRAIFQFDHADLIISVIILTDMFVHLLAYEKGADDAGTDFAITLGGIMYIGWIGSYLISLRDLPNGLWWFMLVMPAAWLADSGAYLFGSRFGKHQFSPRISPRKTWEGYFGGILFGTVCTVLFAALWKIRMPSLTLMHGLILGLLMGIVTPLGDLAESVFKRQVGEKDSSNLIPGHGGFFDRIDSWIWAGVIGYYLVSYLWI
ncbi:MAG TPA: phosphatidate cytidylyltransferase [Desulfatirhabdiaceae bacterium]|nr:phosphatidate cytidylyltransferase [Desulfatirhabdiaceae bacterium]